MLDKWQQMAQLNENVNTLLDMAETFAPGQEEAFLTSISNALKCEHYPRCNCGGGIKEHWPQALETVCTYTCGLPMWWDLAQGVMMESSETLTYEEAAAYCGKSLKPSGKQPIVAQLKK